METPSFFDPARFRARDEGVVVNVNVQGSVVAQNDLVAAVTDAVYATQRSGNNLLLAE
jgi:copper chaperone CopZ